MRPESIGAHAAILAGQAEIALPAYGPIQIVVPEAIGFISLPELEVGPSATKLALQWAPVPGATDAEVTGCELAVRSVERIETATGLPVTTPETNVREIAIPAGRRVRSLTLSGLKHAGQSLTEHGHLDADKRLVVSVRRGDAWWPAHAVPAVGGSRVQPARLAGASVAGGLLRLPDLAADRIRLTLAKGDDPDAFTPEAFELGSVSAQLVALPADAALKHGTTVLWQHPGALGPEHGMSRTSLAPPVAAAMSAAVKAGSPPRLDLSLTAAQPSRIGVAAGPAHGFLVRSQPGTQRHELAGAPRRVEVGEAALAAEVPSRVTADVRVRYDGMRILDAPRDPVPPAAGGLSGRIVGATPEHRLLAPQLFAAYPPARIGLVARAPEPADLELTLVRAAGDVATAEPLAPAATATVQASRQMQVVWFDLPELEAPLPPAAVSVRATSGRLFWAGHPAGVQIAVHDPDPGGRPVRIGAHTLLAVQEADQRLPGATLPAAAFATAAPHLQSDLLCTVELSDLTLRYAR